MGVNTRPGEALSPLRPDENPPASATDYARAQQVLVDLRTAAPSYKEPARQKRSLLRSKRKKEALADTDTWTFTLHEIGRGPAHVFEGQAWESVEVVRGLLAMGGGESAEQLWQRSLHPDKKGIERLFSKTPASSLNSDVPCPWLDKAVQCGRLSAVGLLCGSGMTQQCLDAALEKALRTKKYDIAKALVSHGSQFPPDEALYTAAASPAPSGPDSVFLRLWLSAHSPPNHQTALVVIRKAVQSSPWNAAMGAALSMLLANIGVSASEAYDLLLVAIKAERLEAIAAVSLATQSHRGQFQGQALEATKLAAKMVNDSARYKTLAFLFSAGSRADTPELRDRLRCDANGGRLGHVQLLIKAGVPPYKPDADTLRWAVKNVRRDVFDVLLGGHIPPDAATAAVATLPRTASEGDKMHFVSSLAKKGASTAPLGRLLLKAVQDSHHHLVNLLLRLGATSSYKEDRNQNSLCIAAQRGDVPLVEKLCLARPTSEIASEALDLAFESLKHRAVDDLLRALSLLLAQGAGGAAIDVIVLKALSHPNSEEILRTLLPVVIRSTTAGKAVNIVIRQPGTETLELICNSTTVKSGELATALDHALYANTRIYEDEKALILSRTAKRHGYQDVLDRLMFNPARDTHPKADQIVDMLLANGASINAGGGHVLATAAASADPVRLEELLRARPNTSSLEKALEIAIISRRDPIRLSVARLILGASNSHIGQTAALLRVVGERGPNTQDRLLLVSLLLDNDASVDFENGRTLARIVKRDNELLLRTVMQRVPPPHQTTMTAAFETALGRPREIRLPLARILLSYGVSVHTRSTHLISATKSRGTALLELMLAHGNIDWKHGAPAFHYAAEHHCIPELDLLIRHGGMQHLAVDALSALVGKASLDNPDNISVATSLLRAGIPLPARNAALVSVCRRSSVTEPLPSAFISLLIQHGAESTAEEGLLFGRAANRAERTLLELLTTKPFDLGIAIKSIIGSVHSLQTVVNSFDFCVERSNQLGGSPLHQNSLVRLAINRFPDSRPLIARLLDIGCQPGKDIAWALEESEASSDVILELLSRTRLGKQRPTICFQWFAETEFYPQMNSAELISPSCFEQCAGQHAVVNLRS